MRRGTTPVLTFDLPFDVSELQKLWLTFAQNGKEVFTVEKKACTATGNKIEVALTQAQTLALRCNCEVEMQMRALTLEGAALASNILKVRIDRILKDGEI